MLTISGTEDLAATTDADSDVTFTLSGLVS